CEAATPFSTMWRSRMPVRSRIHSSLVSTIFSRSRFESTRGGTQAATPVILAAMRFPGWVNELCSRKESAILCNHPHGGKGEPYRAYASERSERHYAGYSLTLSSFFFFSRASPRTFSAQASQMVFADGFPQIMQTCFFAAGTIPLPVFPSEHSRFAPQGRPDKSTGARRWNFRPTRGWKEGSRSGRRWTRLGAAWRPPNSTSSR